MAGYIRAAFSLAYEHYVSHALYCRASALVFPGLCPCLMTVIPDFLSKPGKAVKFKSNSLFLLLLVIAIIVFLCPEVGILRSEQACSTVIP